MDTQWKGRALGAILLESELIKPDDIERALEEQKRSGVRFGEALVGLGIVSTEDVNWGLSHQLNLPFVRVRFDMIDPEASRLTPEALARRHRALPYLLIGDELTVLIEDPTNARAIAELGAITGKRIIVGVGMPEEIRQALDYIYGPADAPRAAADVESTMFDAGQIAAMTGDATGRAFLDTVLSAALREETESVHFDPSAGAVRVRFCAGERAALVATLSRSWMHVVAHGLRARLQQVEQAANLVEGVLSHGDGEREVQFHAAIAQTMEGEAIVLTVLDAPLLGATLAESEGDVGAAQLLSMIGARRGLTVIVGPRTPWKRRLTSLLMVAAAERHAKCVAVTRRAGPATPGWLRIAASPGRLDPTAALEAAVALEPSLLAFDDLLDGSLLSLALREAIRSRAVMAGLPMDSMAAAMRFLLDRAESRALLAEGLRGFIVIDRAPLLSPEHSAPDERKELALSLLALSKKEAAGADLRRATASPVGPPRFGKIVVRLPAEPEIAALLRSATPVDAVVEAVRAASRDLLAFALRDRVLRGELALDDYLMIVEGRGHGAA